MSVLSSLTLAEVSNHLELCVALFHNKELKPNLLRIMNQVELSKFYLQIVEVLCLTSMVSSALNSDWDLLKVHCHAYYSVFMCVSDVLGSNLHHF